METVRKSLQVLLVVVSALAFAIVGVIAGLQRDGLAADLTDAVIASPDARQEVGAAVAVQIEDAVPLLKAVTEVGEAIPAVVESLMSEAGTRVWIEREVRAQLGEDVAPMTFRLGDVVDSSDPFVALAVQAVPEIEIESRVSTTSTAIGRLNSVGLVTMVLASASFIATRLLVGRARAAILTGSGGLAASAGLWLMPGAAELDSALSAIAASTVVTPQLVATTAGIATLLVVRGALAQTAVLPYRKWTETFAGDEGSMDPSFEF